MGTDGASGVVRAIVVTSMATLLLLGSCLLPVAEPSDGLPNPVPIIDVTLSPSTQRAIVTNERNDIVVFEGTVTIEQLSRESARVTLEGTIDHGWSVAITLESTIVTGPGALDFEASVDVPAGMKAGMVGNLLVTATAEVPVLLPITATASSQVIVSNTDPTPRWTVRITEPLEGAIVTGDVVTVTGTAAYGGGAVSAVEVRACTGPWVRAKGTSEWTIDADMSLLDDGPHRIAVRARSGEAVSPPVFVNVTQDRASTAGDPGGGGVLPPPVTPEEEGWSTAQYLTMLLAAVGVLVCAYGYSRWRRYSNARAWIDRYGT